jgi:hypothetical protein
MDQLTIALGPVFVAGFAVQQFLEILMSILNLDSNASFEKYKKAILSVASLAMGFLLAYCIPSLRVLHAVDSKNALSGWDLVVTAFVLSAGTEGINSIVKFMKYSKEDKKETAALKDASAASASGLQRMNRV